MQTYCQNRRTCIEIDQKISKFVEALWRFIFYSVFCIVGYNTLFVPETVTWVKDVSQYWSGWPKQIIEETVRHYYLVQLGCYLHQVRGIYTKNSCLKQNFIWTLTAYVDGSIKKRCIWNDSTPCSDNSLDRVLLPHQFYAGRVLHLANSR